MGLELKPRFTYEYPRPSVTVDCVVFGYGPDGPAADCGNVLKVLLVERKEDPFAGSWALPGGFVNVRDDADQGESLDAAARRELAEETGLGLDHLEQLYTFGKPGRDPRGRVIDVAYLALVRELKHPVTAGSDAAKADWWALGDIDMGMLAFDHAAILSMAVSRLRSKVRYAPLGFDLLDRTFTLRELRDLYEAILGRKLELSNFRRKALATGVLVETGGSRKDKTRPAKLYRFDKRKYDEATAAGFNFEI